MLRVIVPWTRLHDATIRSLNKHAPHYERVELDASDDDAYWRLLCELWSAAEPFVLVEHDMEIHAGVIETFESCRRDWCVFPYEGPPHPMAPRNRVFRCALGCVRFRPPVMHAHPNLIQSLAEGQTLIFGRYANTDWNRLDSQIASLLFQRGVRACEHEPWVTHHHDYTTTTA